MSDYSRPYTVADAALDHRKAEASARIRKMPAENLTVGELLDIITVFRGINYGHSMGENDLGVLDRILATHRPDHHCGK